MKARVSNPAEKKAQRLRTSQKQASIRAERIKNLRQVLYGEELASNFRFEQVDTGEGEVYYLSLATGESTWDLPQGAVVVNRGKAETDVEEFEEAQTADGNVYYVGKRSGSVWELPSNGVVVPSAKN